MDRAKIKRLTQDIEDALRGVADKHGVEIAHKSSTFTHRGATVRLTVSEPNADGSVDNPHRDNYRRSAPLFGLQADWLDRELTLRGEQFKVVGLRPRARKRPVLVERLRDQKLFALESAAVRRELGAR